MKKKIFLGLLFTFSSVFCYMQPDSVIEENESLQMHEDNFCLFYLRSTLPGIFTGGGVGILNAFIDKLNPRLFPWTWLLAGLYRSRLDDAVSKDMKEKKVSHNSLLLEFSSCISSWAAYYITYSKLHGYPPF